MIMEKKDYIAPKLKAKEIDSEEMMAASEKPSEAPTSDKGETGNSKSSFWHNFDNEE